MLQNYIEIYYSFFFRLQLYYLPYAPLTVFIQNRKTEHFQHTQTEQLEWIQTRNTEHFLREEPLYFCI